MHNLIKNLFSIVVNLLRGLQFILAIVALLTMVDFILFLTNVQLPQAIQGVFDNIYNFTSKFYQPDLSTLEVDFTLAIAAIAILIAAGIVVYLVIFINDLEQQYDKFHADQCRKYEQKLNSELKSTIDNMDAQNNQFAIFYSLSVIPNAKIPLMNQNKNINFEAKTSDYRVVLKNTMINSFNAVCKHTTDGYILFFEKFEDCEKVFAKLYEFINKAKELLKKEALTINIRVSAVLAKRTDNTEIYLPKMKKLINISIPEKVMILAEFKEKYDKLPEHNYKITAQGEYSFNDEIIDVYSLEP